MRKYQNERILVVANLSRFVQYVHLDLKEYAARARRDVRPHPSSRDRRDAVSAVVDPHSFMWFDLAAPVPTATVPAEVPPDGALMPAFPVLAGAITLEKRFRQRGWGEIEAVLPDYMRRNRLVDGGQHFSPIQIQHAFPLEVRGAESGSCLSGCQRDRQARR